MRENYVPGALPGLLSNWCGPAEWNVYDALWRPVLVQGHPSGRGVNYESYTIPAVKIRLDPARSEVRDRLVRWLAAGDPCPCRGTGTRTTVRGSSHADVPCTECSGDGWRRAPHDLRAFLDDPRASRTDPCRPCRGTGYIDDALHDHRACGACSTTGRVPAGGAPVGLTPAPSAAVLGWSARAVARGEAPIFAVYGPWEPIAHAGPDAVWTGTARSLVACAAGASATMALRILVLDESRRFGPGSPVPTGWSCPFQVDPQKRHGPETGEVGRGIVDHVVLHGRCAIALLGTGDTLQLPEEP